MIKTKLANLYHSYGQELIKLSSLDISSIKLIDRNRNIVEINKTQEKFKELLTALEDIKNHEIKSLFMKAIDQRLLNLKETILFLEKNTTANMKKVYETNTHAMRLEKKIGKKLTEVRGNGRSCE